MWWPSFVKTLEWKDIGDEEALKWGRETKKPQAKNSQVHLSPGWTPALPGAQSLVPPKVVSWRSWRCQFGPRGSCDHQLAHSKNDLTVKKNSFQYSLLVSQYISCSFHHTTAKTPGDNDQPGEDIIKTLDHRKCKIKDHLLIRRAHLLIFCHCHGWSVCRRRAIKSLLICDCSFAVI